MSTAWIVISLVVFVALYVVLLVVDIWLMRRYAGRDPRTAEPEHGPDGGAFVLMDLQIFWFVLIAVLWGGYFLLEGFDFGVGMLLPFLPRDERERSQMLGRSARSGTATRCGWSSPAARRSRPSRPGTRRCSRASTSRCCSSSSS